MPEERVKHWVMTQERALQLYELIQTSLDPQTWEVLVKSENTKVPLGEFLDKARKRIIYKPEFGNYSPSTVADDALVILDSLNVTFDQIRNRLEDSFRSVLVVNEDMDQFIKNMESETATKEEEINVLSTETMQQKDEIKMLREELRKKEAGIQPLADVIRIRISEMINLYKEFKALIGDETEMVKFLPIFEKEVDTTIKLIEMRREQVLSSSIDYSSEEVSEALESANEEYVQGVPVSGVDDELAKLDDRADYTGNMDSGTQMGEFDGEEKPFREEKKRDTSKMTPEEIQAFGKELLAKGKKKKK